MEVTITADMFWFIFAIVGIATLVLAIIAFLRLNETLNVIKRVLTKNEANIDETLQSMPKVLSNVEEITKEINGEMKNIKEAFKNIDETAEYTASAMQMVNEDILDPLKDILSIISVVRDILGKPKKKGIFK